MAKIISCKEIGEQETYDLEVEHKDHQFYLSNGLLTSNSHSVSYSVISYQTAWLRCHFPTEFMCALLNNENPNEDKAQEYLNECKNMGIEILPPDINKSSSGYTIVGDKQIATGLSAIKGVGAKALVNIIENQPFKNIADFFHKTEGRTVNKTVIQSLAKAGAFDTLGHTRKDIYENYDSYRRKVNASIQKGIEVEDIVLDGYDDEWSQKEILVAEKEILGRTISGSLHEVFEGFFKKNSSIVMALGTLNEKSSGAKVRVEAIVNSKIKEFKIKKGKNIGRKFAKYLIEDIHGDTAELTVWADDYDRYKDFLKDGVPFKAICKVDEYMGQKGLSLFVLENVLGKRV